jgi:GTP-binding protein YchF
MEAELLLADLMSIESRIASLEKELKRSKNPDGEKEVELLQKVYSQLEEGAAVRETDLSSSEEKILRGFALLTQKPLFHMINVDENNIAAVDQPESIYSSCKKGTVVLAYCGSIEKEIAELEGDEKKDFLKEYGLAELSTQKFLKTSYNLLQVITFFTIGKAEIKAWTIDKNTSAVQAAGAIHSDIERGFIRAEVIPWNELLKHGSFLVSKEQAAVRLEGKDYIIQDGDIIQFRFST